LPEAGSASKETGSVSWANDRMNGGASNGAASRFKPMREAQSHDRIARIFDIPAGTLLEAVALVTGAGCGIMFSPTSDGGALGVHVYSGTDRYRDYAPTREEFLAVLDSARDIAEARMITGTRQPVKLRVEASQKT
jgi:hypothetical protein